MYPVRLAAALDFLFGSVNRAFAATEAHVHFKGIISLSNQFNMPLHCLAVLQQ
jgi:hypothetical protein